MELICFIALAVFVLSLIVELIDTFFWFIVKAGDLFPEFCIYRGPVLFFCQYVRSHQALPKGKRRLVCQKMRLYPLTPEQILSFHASYLFYRSHSENPDEDELSSPGQL